MSLIISQRNGFSAAGAGGRSTATEPVVFAEATSADSVMYPHVLDGSYYGGQRQWSDASAHTIRRVSFLLGINSGSVSGFTYVAKLWTHVNTYSLNEIKATSTGVVGDNNWSDTWVNFNFPAPFTTTGSTEYAFTLDRGGYDGSNAILMRVQNSGGTISGSWDKWSSAGEITAGSGNDLCIKLWE